MTSSSRELHLDGVVWEGFSEVVTFKLKQELIFSLLSSLFHRTYIK